METFCEDLLSREQLNWADACPVDERTLADLMGEIQDPALRLKLLRLCVELAEADAHVAEGESIVLVAAVEHSSSILLRKLAMCRQGPAKNQGFGIKITTRWMLGLSVSACGTG